MHLYQKQSTTRGFSLLELLVVIFMGGILAAIAAPSWLTFWNTQKLNAAQSKVFEVLRLAQNTAKLKHIKYQVSFKQADSRVRWIIHPSSADPDQLVWNSLDKGIQLDTGTTLSKSNDLYRVQFNHNGEVSGQLGRVTLSASPGQAKRCVVVSTLLGAMRSGQNKPKQKGNPCD